MKLKAILFTIFSLVAMPAVFAAPGTISAGLFGAGFWGGLPANGFEFDLHLGPRFSIAAAYRATSYDYSDAIKSTVEELQDGLEVDVEKAQLTRSATTLGLKFFPFAGSFNIAAHAGVGKYSNEIRITSPMISEVIDESYNADTTVAAITFGNTWRWQFFYFGFDWLGWESSAASSEERESETSEALGVAMSEGIEFFDDLNDSIAKQGGLIFIGLRIGVGF